MARRRDGGKAAGGTGGARRRITESLEVLVSAAKVQRARGGIGRVLHGITEGVAIALDAIRTNKLRSGLTILGVVIGVSTVMSMASIVSGIRARGRRADHVPHHQVLLVDTDGPGQPAA